MNTLAECLVINSRGKSIYAIKRSVSFEQKRQLLKQFVSLHAGQQAWRVRMHMPKRNMPFVQHGNILFRGSKLAVNELLIELDITTIIGNSMERDAVWDVMRNFFPAKPLSKR